MVCGLLALKLQKKCEMKNPRSACAAGICVGVTTKVTKELLLRSFGRGEATPIILNWCNGVEPKLEPWVHGRRSRKDETQPDSESFWCHGNLLF